MTERDDGSDRSASVRGRAIALFSDGTGNSSAKLFKTNVWRMYQALDLAEPRVEKDGKVPARQLAYYDDGVGTSSFKPLALLGGALGWGLKRNVLDLYTFLCRNYQPGDRIHAFGFSRGAFTIRVLVGLVVDQGLIKCATEEELQRYARDAYRAFRRCFNRTGGLVTPLRNGRDALIRGWRRLHGQKTYDEVDKTAPDGIAFVGVWDTVAAYGTPITELTRGIDKWVWPLSMPNYKLSEHVKEARHALALDDERDTFHPLLWDEVEEQKLVEAQKVAPGRLQQVWFAGMHSDVGGGYPDDGLAHVSLSWMIDGARAAGLRFHRKAVEDIERARNEFAPIHDSRRGLGGYYRYQPRKIGARIGPPEPTTLVMRDPDLKGRGLLTGVKIHESVIERIRYGPDRYAPIVLPGDYQMVAADGRVVASPERADRAARRAERQEAVWDDVWRRRVNYFTMVGVSLCLAALPLLDLGNEPPTCAGPQCVLAPVISSAGAVLPGFAEPWISAFSARPALFAIAAAAIALLLLRSAGLNRRIHDGMRRLWDRSLAKSDPAPAAGSEENGRPSWVYRLRTNYGYQRTFQFLKWKLAPNVLGISLLIAIVLLVPVTASRARLALAERSNDICDMSAAMSDLKMPGAAFPTEAFCWPTRVEVDEGGRYRISFEVTNDWIDQAIETSPEGFGSERMPWYLRYGAVPFRRSLGDDWFQPLLKIVQPESGSSRLQAVKVRPADDDGSVYTGEFEALQTGLVFLAVNDAIAPWPAPIDFFYRKNYGGAAVTIEPIEPESQASHASQAASTARR